MCGLYSNLTITQDDPFVFLFIRLCNTSIVILHMVWVPIIVDILIFLTKDVIIRQLEVAFSWENTMSFGKNLRSARRESGKTQNELAECLAVTRQSVSKWETGEGYPEIEKLIQIVAVLDVSLDELFSDEIHTNCQLETAR